MRLKLMVACLCFGPPYSLARSSSRAHAEFFMLKCPISVTNQNAGHSAIRRIPTGGVINCRRQIGFAVPIEVPNGKKISLEPPDA